MTGSSMKLRIKGNSLRLRVSPSEMTLLLQTGRIEDAIHFGPVGGARLVYALEHRPELPAMRVQYEPNEITVAVSSQEAKRWASGRDVGLYGEVGTGHETLELAVEKDFACLDQDNAENGETFPNPKQGKVC
jgi:hypothetical protein